MARETGSRRAAFRRGLNAETAALLFLVAKGYWPMARRYRGGGGEIDLVVARGRTVVFVEVKQRDDGTEALAAVTPGKLRRIGRAARAFQSERRLDSRHLFRCDIVVVDGFGWPRHIQDIGLPET
jgi:putative endonuclease